MRKSKFTEEQIIKVLEKTSDAAPTMAAASESGRTAMWVGPARG